jgi:hypothetical protein
LGKQAVNAIYLGSRVVWEAAMRLWKDFQIWKESEVWRY